MYCGIEAHNNHTQLIPITIISIIGCHEFLPGQERLTELSGVQEPNQTGKRLGIQPGDDEMILTTCWA